MVFKINTDGTGFTNIYTFTGDDGAVPHGNLVLSGNTLYGTTQNGGYPSGSIYSGPSGTIFAVNTDGTGFTNLYKFTPVSGFMFGPFINSDGAYPEGSLILSGNTLYGTTEGGGSSGVGTVFTINTDGSGFTNLYVFTGGNDGAYPQAGLVLSGNTLYGTAFAGGGFGQGTVFAININGTDFTSLYDFTGGNDGAYPEAGLVLSGETFYGTAYQGGSLGYGTIFALSLPVAAPALSIALASVPGLTTNSTGIFIFASSLGVGVTPASVVAFKNVDGNVDLVCANASSGSLTVLTNNGGGIFYIQRVLFRGRC